jgi:formylglycine-generating enzyme required for sulfatase activity
MLLRLAATGNFPTHQTRLRNLISPLICSHPEEQRQFQQEFEKWMDRISGSDQAISKSMSPIEKDIKRFRLWGRMFMIAIIVCFLGIGISLFFQMPSRWYSGYQTQQSAVQIPVQSDDSNMQTGNSPQMNVSEPIHQLSYYWIFSGAGIFFLLLWLFWVIWMADRHITRHYTDDDVHVIHRRVEDFSLPMFKSLAFTKTIREYHAHQPEISTQINVPKTIEKSISQWPAFVPVFGKRLIRPEYLILIDQTSFQDHQASLVSALIDQLLAYEVYAHVYYFDGDPRTCTPSEDPSQYFSLFQLACRHAHYRLLIFSDAKDLLDPLSGQPFQWVRLFDFWEDRALFLPGPLFSESSYHPLQDCHFLIVPASPDGMASLIHQLNDNRSIKIQGPSAHLPDILLVDTTDWCEHHPPDEARIHQLLIALRSNLDDATFFWMCACAVYPHLLWHLTLFLGNQLKNEDQTAVFQENRLAVLSSLPWFRTGSMPDWLRSRLLDELTDQQEKQVRNLIITLLLKMENVSDNKKHLTFHHYKNNLARRMLSRLKKRFKSKPHALSPVHDRIFIQFVENRLSVRITNQIYRNIRKLKFDVLKKSGRVDLISKQINRNLPRPQKKSIVQKIDQIEKKLIKDTKIDIALQMEFQWIEGGCFMMGQTETEKEQIIKELGQEDYDKYFKWELPQHEVCVNGFWMAKYPVTVGQFRQFVEATNYQTDAEKAGEAYTVKDGSWESVKDISWKNPGFEQTDDHPAVCLSWNDGVALSKWLSEKNDAAIRLPTEAEWEYACRAGSTTARFWGDDPDQACRFANVADLTAKEKINFKYIHNCEDGYVYTSPVGTFMPNPWGLYDMLGNVWEWNLDVFDEEAYQKHERNNPVMESEGNRGASIRVLRGGSWNGDPAFVRCAARFRDRPTDSNTDTGQRILWTA